MHNVLCVAVVDGLEQLFHVVSGLILTKSLIVLLRNSIEQRLARNELHDQVYVLLVVVSLIVLDDVRMVELAHDSHLFHDAFLFLYLVFIYNFYGNFEISIMIIPRVKDTITVFSLSQ